MYVTYIYTYTYINKSNVVPQTTLSDYIDHQVLKDGPIQRDGIPTYVFSNPVSMKGVQLEAQDLFPQVFTLFDFDFYFYFYYFDYFIILHILHI
jgi:hypothetical protein